MYTEAWPIFFHFESRYVFGLSEIDISWTLRLFVIICLGVTTILDYCWSISFYDLYNVNVRSGNSLGGMLYFWDARYSLDLNSIWWCRAYVARKIESTPWA